MKVVPSAMESACHRLATVAESATIERDWPMQAAQAGRPLTGFKGPPPAARTLALSVKRTTLFSQCRPPPSSSAAKHPHYLSLEIASGSLANCHSFVGETFIPEKRCLIRE